MIERAVILVVAVAATFLLVRLSERIRPRGRSIRPGITVVTGPDCRFCDSLVQRLSADSVSHERVDARDLACGITVRSVPTVLVAGTSGEIVMRRSGRSALTDYDAILRAAHVSGALRRVG